MPLDSIEFAQDPLLAKLGHIERLLATEQQWCKGRLRDGEGRHCLVGAIEAADAWQEMPRIILRAAREVSGKRYWRIEAFNDHPLTTHRDVLLVLRRAREDILAQMAARYQSHQPCYRKWAQSLGTALFGSARRSVPDLPSAREAPPASPFRHIPVTAIMHERSMS